MGNHHATSPNHSTAETDFTAKKPTTATRVNSSGSQRETESQKPKGKTKRKETSGTSMGTRKQSETTPAAASIPNLEPHANPRETLAEPPISRLLRES
ncbi:hypothetical protein QYF36_026524 [Acer negundo]|nr:hypothetical protein QYF36_026524 [Acer negundo]